MNNLSLPPVNSLRFGKRITCGLEIPLRLAQIAHDDAYLARCEHLVVRLVAGRRQFSNISKTIKDKGYLIIINAVMIQNDVLSTAAEGFE